MQKNIALQMQGRFYRKRFWGYDINLVKKYWGYDIKCGKKFWG